MQCSILIVSYNTRDILERCLERLYASQGIEEYEVIVVDNASSDGSPEMLRRRFPMARLVAMPWNTGFARANNLALRESSGKFLALLNPDAFVRPDTLAAALRFMHARPSAGACGGLLLSEEGAAAPSARRFPSAFSKFCQLWGLADRFAGSPLFDRHDYRHRDLAAPLPVDWVPGTFTVLRRSALLGLPLFDERYFMYYEETDLCRRLAAQGYEVWFVPDVKVAHIGGASAKTVKKDFDASGAQVLLWRLRSEYLYLRKNHGPLTVLAHAGIEMALHATRMAANVFRSGPKARSKRQDARRRLTLCLRALADTRLGAFSPAAPWT